MNYIAEIKAFYDLVQVKQLSTGQIALWHALMHINNKCAWIEWFTVPNLTLELNTGLSRSGIYKARNILKQYGVIDFKANGTKATSYKLVSLLNSNQVSEQGKTALLNSKQVGKQDGNQVGKQVGKQDSNQVGNTLNKLNETKQNNDVDDNPQTPFEVVVKIFRESGMGEINSTIADILGFIADNHPLELIEEAFLIAGANHATSVRYVEKILIAWAEKGIKSKQQLELYENNRRRGNGSSKGDNGRSSGEPDPYADIGITL